MIAIARSIKSKPPVIASLNMRCSPFSYFFHLQRSLFGCGNYSVTSPSICSSNILTDIFLCFFFSTILCRNEHRIDVNALFMKLVESTAFYGGVIYLFRLFVHFVIYSCYLFLNLILLNLSWQVTLLFRHQQVEIFSAGVCLQLIYFMSLAHTSTVHSLSSVHAFYVFWVGCKLQDLMCMIST